MKYLLGVLLTGPLWAQMPDQLEAHGVSVAKATYQGKSAVRLDALPDAANDEFYAIVKGSRFRNGTIEVELAEKPGANARPGARGFIGMAFRAFRVQGDRYEYIYLRSTNGRADEQVRRNHSTQYGSRPEFDFERLRKESPERYESYVDLEPGVWTKYRIVVDGTKARLFVHGAGQPCLIVNELLCGRPHNRSSVAQRIMWRRNHLPVNSGCPMAASAT